jgi:hypothetical protein
MKNSSFFYLMFSVMNVLSADVLQQLECHDKTVTHAVATLSYAREVEHFFGTTNVDHFISTFGSKTHQPIWNSLSYFEGRYKFSLRIPIEIDYENCRFISVKGPVSVQVNEVTSVEISKSGIAGANLRKQWRLNEEQWKKLVKHNGDWAAVGVHIWTNAPVKQFDDYARQGRAPIRDRKAGFDDPIKRALEKSRSSGGKVR